MIRNFLLASALAGSFSAHGQSGVSLELGRGSDSAGLMRVGVEWNWERKWALGEDWQLAGHMEFSAGGWQNSEKVAALAALPVFRIERSYSSVVPYVEGGIGLNLLSQVEAGSGRLGASRLQLGDHVGAGLRFGDQRRHEIGLRLQRLSDGGVARPNPGMSFGVVRYQYNFE
jgi:lipid A 3-O-deacylase